MNVSILLRVLKIVIEGNGGIEKCIVEEFVDYQKLARYAGRVDFRCSFDRDKRHRDDIDLQINSTV